MTDLTPEAQAQLAKLAVDLANNPKTRKQFVGLVKEIDPTKRFADVEIDEIREGVKREFEDRDQKSEQKRILDRQEAQKHALSDRYKPEDVTEIENIMTKYGMSDYEAAAKIYAHDAKPAAPTYEQQDHRWEMPQIKIEDFGKLKQIGRQRAYQTIDEIRRKH